MNEADIKAILLSFQPATLQALGSDWLSEKNIKKIELSSERVVVELELGYPIADLEKQLSKEIKTKLLEQSEIKQVDVHLRWKVIPYAVGSGIKSVAGVKNIIAIASGKGGVGKSTTTVNLALALSAQGARVGILDADIYGPNQPHMLGASDEIMEVPSGTLFQPKILHGIQSMSMGYLVAAKTPMIWRGPMVSSALQQLLQQTEWHELDYLFIDLPPGTGDIQLTLSQKVPVTAAVIITTPQDISLLDARKGLEMFHKVKVPVLGIIENMSLHTCSVCGHQEAIFGSGGGEHMAAECEVPLLGQLPLAKSIREAVDQGRPTVVAEPNSPAALLYQQIARLIAIKLTRQAPNYTVKFQNIVVE